MQEARGSPRNRPHGAQEAFFQAAPEVAVARSPQEEEEVDAHAQPSLSRADRPRARRLRGLPRRRPLRKLERGRRRRPPRRWPRVAHRRGRLCAARGSHLRRRARARAQRARGHAPVSHRPRRHLGRAAAHAGRRPRRLRRGSSGSRVCLADRLDRRAHPRHVHTARRTSPADRRLRRRHRQALTRRRADRPPPRSSPRGRDPAGRGDPPRAGPQPATAPRGRRPRLPGPDGADDGACSAPDASGTSRGRTRSRRSSTLRRSRASRIACRIGHCFAARPQQEVHPQRRARA